MTHTTPDRSPDRDSTTDRAGSHDEPATEEPLDAEPVDDEPVDSEPVDGGAVRQRQRPADAESSRERDEQHGRDERRERRTPERNTDERSSEERSTVERECPECAGSLRSNERQGETVCSDCGLVVAADEVDRGPEWRAFDPAEKAEKSRVGAPTTKLLHDEGLSATIGWQNKDAYGNAISGEKRERLRRMRQWDERFRTQNARERNLKQALGEIDRMASALGLPENVRETAAVIYRRALEEDLLPGRSIEGIATASLYAAARQAGVPRSLDEFDVVSRVEQMEVQRAYRYVSRELELAVAPADPVSYLDRFGSELGVSEEAIQRARELLEKAKAEGMHSGKSPVGMAAAALYAGPRLVGESVTQAAVSEVTDVSEVTIRNRYQELLKADRLR